MTRIDRYREEDRPAWNEFVNSHPEGTFFHRAEWIGIVEAYYGFPSLSFLVRNGREIAGVVPLFLCRSPLLGKFLLPTPLCGRLNFCADAAAQEAVWEEIRRRRAACGARYAELRFDSAHARDGLPTNREHVLQCLSLESGEAQQWKKIEPSVRNKVRQSEKHGLKLAGGHVLLDAFYRLYLSTMREFGYPPLGKGLFRSLLREFGESMEILAAFREETPAAAVVNFHYKDTVTNLWGASSRSQRHLRPNNFLYWGALRQAIGRRRRFFDFGRSRAGSGVFQFKKQWGAATIPLSYQYLTDGGAKIPSVGDTQGKYRLAMAVWRNLPLKVTEIFGPRLGKWAPL